MKAVGLRELKNRLSEYIRDVRAGETVLVTDRGEVVAEIAPPGRTIGDSAFPPGLQDLVRRGLARAPRKLSRHPYPVMPRVLKPGEFERLLDEDRDDR